MLATAAVVSVALPASEAWALALGRVNVQSALGEPLRAEVEIPQITAAEAEGLRVGVASPGVFRTQGMEYNATASQVRVSVQRRADGSAVLRLTSTQPVNEPFVDLVIDASWASGNLQRNYTLLLDPPTLQKLPPAVTAAAQASAPEPAAAPRRAAAPAPSQAAAGNTEESRPAPAAQRRAAPAARERAAAAPAPSEASEVRIKTGDTAGRIAAAHLPAGVSLDQMLVAMLRTNPKVFINGNVNRMRSGAVLTVPDEATAQATSPREARQIVAAQSRDFNQFRRQLASAAPAAPVASANREASGSVQAQVEDRKPSTAAPDKLTLSKGAVKGVEADERLAKQKQSDDQASRTAELQRNMSELSQIAAATKPAEGGAAAPAAAAGGTAAGVAVPGAPTVPAVPEAAAPQAPAPAAPADAAATAAPDAAATAAAATAAAETAPATPAPAEPPKPKPAPAPAAPIAEPSFIDTLLEDPAIPLAGAALLALLLGYGGYRVMQRRRAAAASSESAFGDSQLAADSFFGASGGQRVDTGTSSQLSGTSMHYSPSQLDAGDVDPVAEADVYLAYGRDLQAEEILKEALRTDPNRTALHQKLADIYAKRHDRKAFEAVAQTLHGLTQGKGVDWQRLADQGRILDPENALYQPAGSAPLSAAAVAGGATVAAAGLAAASLATSRPLDMDVHREGPATLPMDLDMDLNMDLPGGLADASLPAQHASPLPAPAPMPSEQDFAALEPTLRAPLEATPSAKDDTPRIEPRVEPPVASLDMPGFQPTAHASLTDALNHSNAMDDMRPTEMLSLDMPGSQATDSFPATEPSPLTSSTTDDSHAKTELLSLDAMEFNLEGLSTATPAPTPATPQAGGVLETAAEAKPEPAESLEFDLGSLSLDLGNDTPAVATPPSAPEDPLATKLALAQEFNAIGDSDGARTLIEEVIAEAHGDLKARAQRLLAEID
ncbi:FimV/HubP family polar landmark protein [Delftia acidovorans]|uniref:FimV/HubP family polar landmark protein n=1 Tax=Delftia acidovorans TaxID=80866 RepID=UPI003B27F330